MDKLNALVKELLDQHKGGEQFFDALDYSIRGDHAIMESFKDLIEWNCSRHTVLVVSGNFGRFFVNNFFSFIKELCIDIIVTDGGLRKGNPTNTFLLNEPSSCNDYIFVDDSYYSGSTAKAIEEELGLRFYKIIVVYDGSQEFEDRVYSLFRYYDSKQKL